MSKYLVIVESPAKSTTIEKYLGEDYTVVPSIGHIRDLTTRGFGGFGVDIENNFEPMYKIMKDKHQVVKDLKALVKKSDVIYLATDPDREGEAISWHLYETLGLEKKKYERIVFNEVTKNAVLKAIDNGREIDMDLVHSQESRRIVDRIIGFSLSKLLQKKIGSKSAGRVQSVALKLIVDREKEIDAFEAEEYWDIYLEFNKKKKYKAILSKYNNKAVKISNKDEADKIIASLGEKYIVSNIDCKEKYRASKAPFTTSTLQQDSSSKLNFNAKKTMQLAQTLYEGIDIEKERVGLITYMRTDSVRLSDEFLNDAKKHIIKNYGVEYYKQYNNSAETTKNVQDAHEAIRPSNLKYTPEKVKAYLSPDEFKLYQMIYYRALSAVMSDCKFEETKVSIANNNALFEISGERCLFDGYMKVFSNYEDDNAKALPDFNVKEELKGCSVEGIQKFTNPPLRYNEARLIKKMEELGIGRPSTYAVTIETIKIRGYAKLEKKVFVPTKQGILTSEKLDEYFSKVINVEYTAEMEKDLDLISDGKKEWTKELKEFYDVYKPIFDYADSHMNRIYPIETTEKCPECGGMLLIRNGRFGEFLACSNFPKCHYTEKKEEPAPLIHTGIKCPNCKTGMIVERVSKKGRSKGQVFYACDQYPKCKTTFTSLEELEKLKK